MKTLLALIVSLTLAVAARATNPTPRGSTAIALDPSGAYSFLHVNALGQLITSGLAQIAGPSPGGSVAVAVDPDGNYAFLSVDANGALITTGGGGGGTGTVTSVALTVPNILSVSGSPITTSGTLAVTLATQSANTVFAGPTTGSAATPTFRALVAADLPTGTATTGTGTANSLAKYTGASVIGNSAATDDGTTFTYTGTGGVNAKSVSINDGSGNAGTVKFGQGTPPAVVANTIQDMAPTVVTGYNHIREGSAGSTGLYLGTVSGTTVTDSKTAVGTGVLTALAVNVGSAGAFLTFNGDAGTPSALVGTNISGTAANLTAGHATASDATHLGTFASPDTTAGAITWTSSLYNVYTSAAAATRTYTLPAASSYSGKGLVLYVAAGTNHVNVQPASGAALVLAGTLLTADHYAQCATSAAGNFICWQSDGTNWVSYGSGGTWADAASP